MRGGGLLHWLNNQNRLTNATKNTDTTSYVSVGEIWNAEKGHFDGENLDLLLQYITNNSGLTASAVTTPGSINMTKTSADIRSNTVNGKTTSQDVQVTFGGLTWQVVHLTQDIDGNDIVTLWLSNNKQDAWEGRSATEGTYYGFIDGALYSDWSANWSNGYAYDTDLYPSSMYSTSYIHAVTLNNGRSYATSTSAVTTATQSEDNVFAMFTMDSVAGSVTDYLVTPRKVAYQETENVNTQFGWSNYYPNEAYGTPNGNGTWYTSNNENYDFSSREVYDDWADDTLWLPSLTETGNIWASGSSAGIWQTSTEQRANSTGSNSSMGNVGTTSGTAFNYSWLRSGSSSNANTAYTLNASGSSSGSLNVFSSYAVRPALHLNLNSAAQNAVDAALNSPIWDGSSTAEPTLQNPSASNSETNPYIIDTAAKLAWISANYNNSNCYGKYFLQTENLDLAGHPWTPINNSSNGRAYYYDGGGHTISNLYINTSEQTLNSNNYIGLFGFVYGTSNIKNLGVVGGSISGNNYVGAVVGYAGYTDITSCYNEGVSVTGSSSVGGVAGNIYKGTISNSYNTGTVSGDRSNSVGGVVGYNYDGTISGSYNEGAVTGSSSVGGVAGRNSGGTISNCYNTGAISGTRYVGGVAGYVQGSSNSRAIISSCYSTGEIIRSSGSETSFGGVVGYIENSSSYLAQYVSISWCYYNEETSGSVVTKAIGSGTGYQCYGLTTTEMQGAQNQNWMYLSKHLLELCQRTIPNFKIRGKTNTSINCFFIEQYKNIKQIYFECKAHCGKTTKLMIKN